MQLRKREKNKKIIDVVINKDKNIIWNIDFSEDLETCFKQPDNLYQSIENYVNKIHEYHRNRQPNNRQNTRSIEIRLAKKIVKIKKLTLGEISQKVMKIKNMFLHFGAILYFIRLPG